MFRKQIVAGNWKMNKTAAEARELAAGVRAELAAYRGADVVLCPPFTALQTVAEQIAGSAIGLGAQDMYWEKSGAFTGEISGPMLKAAGCACVILGHSERRALFHETDAVVNRKVKAALRDGLLPIVCVGETLQERESGRTDEVVTRQVQGSLAGMGDAMASIVIAYEPVWAIGTGKTATPAMAQEAHALIRRVLAAISSGQAAASVRIQYGGSVKPENAAELLSQPDIDGALVGGASLDVKSFAAIVRAAPARG